MGRKVAIDNDGEVLIHMSGSGAASDYATLCGLDGDDPAIGLQEVPLPRGSKIDCDPCRQIWEIARQYRASEFGGNHDS